MKRDTMRMKVTKKWARTMYDTPSERQVVSVQAESYTPWPCSIRFTVQEERQAPMIGAEVSVQLEWD